MPAGSHDLSDLLAAIESALARSDRIGSGGNTVSDHLRQALGAARALGTEDARPDEGLRPDELTTENDV